MPNFEQNMRQTVTYWQSLGSDLFDKRTYAAPVTLPCRWEDKAELFKDYHGNEVTSRSKVFLSSDVKLSGYLYLGTSTAADPLTLVDAYEIMQVVRLPDLRNLKTLYVVFI